MEPEVKKLTEKQKRFCDYYIELGNAAEAARKAGYSAKVANTIAAQNLAKLSIRTYIDEALAKLEEQRVASAAEVMQYLTAVMRREKFDSVVVTLTEERSAFEPDQNGTMRKVTVKRDVPEIVEIPARLADANKAAELLGKRFGLFRDSIDVSGDLSLQVTVDYGEEVSQDVQKTMSI